MPIHPYYIGSDIRSDECPMPRYDQWPRWFAYSFKMLGTLPRVTTVSFWQSIISSVVCADNRNNESCLFLSASPKQGFYIDHRRQELALRKFQKMLTKCVKSFRGLCDLRISSEAFKIFIGTCGLCRISRQMTVKPENLVLWRPECSCVGSVFTHISPLSLCRLANYLAISPLVTLLRFTVPVQNFQKICYR